MLLHYVMRTLLFIVHAITFQRVKTIADCWLREVFHFGQSKYVEFNAEGAEEEAQSRVAACPAARSRGSTITEHPEDGPAAPEDASAKGISGESRCDRHRLRNVSFPLVVVKLGGDFHHSSSQSFLVVFFRNTVRGMSSKSKMFLFSVRVVPRRITKRNSQIARERKRSTTRWSSSLRQAKK